MYHTHSNTIPHVQRYSLARGLFRITTRAPITNSTLNFDYGSHIGDWTGEQPCLCDKRSLLVAFWVGMGLRTLKQMLDQPIPTVLPPFIL